MNLCGLLTINMFIFFELEFVSDYPVFVFTWSIVKKIIFFLDLYSMPMTLISLKCAYICLILFLLCVTNPFI